MKIAFAAIVALCVCASLPIRVAADATDSHVESAVAQTIGPLMKRYAIPGMAVGIIVAGHPYVFNYGVASNATGAAIGNDTLFEIGSVTKTFTATLASYARVKGKLSLTDSVSTYLPSLRGSAFGRVTLLELGTHTPGGLPLQVPLDVTGEAQLLRYLQNWKPPYSPGTQRVYSNVGIGLLGVITAKSMNEPFKELMEGTLFPALGMTHSFLDVPPAQMANYARGYTDEGKPIRMQPGVLGEQAYGIRTTAGDLVRYLEANMHMLDVSDDVSRAIVQTHTGYFHAGPLTQDLIWEQYAYPAALDTLLAGNAATMLFDAHAASPIEPPLPPRDDVVLNKTGSTNGFSAYVAFVPGKKLGIVLLANKSYPIAARVRAANAIMAEAGAPL